MRRMVTLYCRARHATPGDRLCPQCTGFLAYVAARLERCPYGPDKPTCANCPVHCYKRAQREYAREIMRYSGPRMLWRHPWLALMHMVDGRRRVAHPMELRRRTRTGADEES